MELLSVYMLECYKVGCCLEHPTRADRRVRPQASRPSLRDAWTISEPCKIQVTHVTFRSPSSTLSSPLRATIHSHSLPLLVVVQSADMPSALSNQASSNGNTVGQELLTQANHALQYLNSKVPRVERTFDEIVSYLSLQHSDPKQLNMFRTILQKGPLQITYNPRGARGAGTYKYRPKLPIENAEDLKRYFQTQKSSLGVKMEDLKDGWDKCADELDKMEQKHELLIIRDKKGTIKTVWQNDSTLAQGIAPEFQRAWHTQALPADDQELREKLEAAGLKPTTAPREMKKATGAKQKKRRINTRGKTTNSHMVGILKDYSTKRYEQG